MKDSSVLRVIVEVDKAAVFQARKDFTDSSGKLPPDTRKAAKLLSQDIIDRYFAREWLDIEKLKI